MIRLITSGFGLGLLKPAPGTWGSLPPVILALALNWSSSLDATTICLAALAVLSGVLCIILGTGGEEIFRRKDAPQIVLDEICGQSLTLLFIPWTSDRVHNAAIIVAGFALFRIFDILKPQPIRAMQKLGGGAGILLDDVLAAIPAWLLTQAVAAWVTHGSIDCECPVAPA
jgi:phosphatidylglycerophosphatase A